MGITWHPDAAAHVELVLGCDPGIQGANSEEVISEYLSDGDDSRLVVPTDGDDAPTVFVVRPLTSAQVSSAQRASRDSVLGQRLLRDLRAAREAFDVSEALRLEADGDVFSASTFTALDDLTDDEMKAVETATEHDRAMMAAVVTMGLVDVQGWGEATLAGIANIAQRSAVEVELYVHIMRITTLGAAGKELSA